MQENKQDGQRADILDKEQVAVEIADIVLQFPSIAELIAHNLMGDIPPDEDTGEEAHHGQEYLASDKVKPVEQGLAKEGQPVIGTQRQRAKGSDDGSCHRHGQGSAPTCGM